MEFGSEFVYDDCELQENELYEYVSDDEYECGMNVSSDSDSDEDISPLYAKCSETLETDSGIKHHSRKDASNSLGDDEFPVPVMKKTSEPKRIRHHWKYTAELPCKSSKRFRRADTNVISIKLQQLVAPSNMHAGDPIHCSKCTAVLSKLTKLNKDGPDKIWKCEFCETRNLVDVEDEEIPTNDDVTFLLEPALSTVASGASGKDESLVVFCVDISGSMCVTTEVPGKLKLRGTSRLERLQSFNSDNSNQFLPHQDRNVTYVSRLQAVQAAVDHQLEMMCKEHPHRRVALVTFDNEVTVIGDGTGTPLSIAGDKLSSQEALSKIGESVTTPVAIKDSRKFLGEKLFNLEEGGGTALGPTLIVAIEIAAKHPGSKIIICTDGMANVGLGRLDRLESEDQNEGQETFYENTADLAVSKGVSVSVITIKGSECRLVHLGKMADKTGGQVNIVDPLKLMEEFSNILAGQIVATNVYATFILHKQLYIVDKNNPENKESRVVRDIGNCTTETEITFEYAMKKSKGKKTYSQDKTKASSQTKNKGAAAEDTTTTDALPEGPSPMEGEQSSAEASSGMSSSTKQFKSPPKEDQPHQLPFQIQVQYTDTDGMKALRVLTQVKPVTQDRTVAEKYVNLDVVGLHTAQQAAQLALEGEYTTARGTVLMNQRLAWRASKATPQKKTWYRRIFSKLSSVENVVGRAQQAEMMHSCQGTTYSDEEGEYEDNATSAGSAGRKKGSKKMARSRNVSDAMANDLYLFHNVPTSKLKE